jgi:hypothetical protein
MWYYAKTLVLIGEYSFYEVMVGGRMRWRRYLEMLVCFE